MLMLKLLKYSYFIQEQNQVLGVDETRQARFLDQSETSIWDLDQWEAELDKPHPAPARIHEKVTVLIHNLWHHICCPGRLQILRKYTFSFVQTIEHLAFVFHSCSTKNAFLTRKNHCENFPQNCYFLACFLKISSQLSPSVHPHVLKLSKQIFVLFKMYLEFMNIFCARKKNTIYFGVECFQPKYYNKYVKACPLSAKLYF